MGSISLNESAISDFCDLVSRLDVQCLGFCTSIFGAYISIVRGFGLGRLSLKAFEWKKGKGGGGWRGLDVRRISFRIVDVFGMSG